MYFSPKIPDCLLTRHSKVFSIVLFGNLRQADELLLLKPVCESLQDIVF